MVLYRHRWMMIEAFRGYTSSSEWLYVKQKVVERDRHVCVDCKGKLPKGKGGMVHHDNYTHWGKGNQAEIDACILLCKGCHTKRHALRSMKLKTPFWASSTADTMGFDDNDTGLKDAMTCLRVV